MTDVVPVTWREGKEIIRKIAYAVNNILNGKINAIGTVTFTANQATTVVQDKRMGLSTNVLLTPLTANAATEYGAGSWYISAQTEGTSFTITHVNSATTGRDFRYTLIG